MPELKSKTTGITVSVPDDESARQLLASGLYSGWAPAAEPEEEPEADQEDDSDEDVLGLEDDEEEE